MKQPKPWFRKAKNTWYVEIDGKQHFLGRHPENAPPPKKGKNGWNAPPAINDAFYAKMRELKEAPELCTNPAPKVLIVAVLCDRFLDAMCPFADGRPTERPAERWKRLGPKARQEPPLRLKESPACTPQTFWWYDAYLQDFCNHRDGEDGQLGLLPAASLLPKHVTAWLDAHPAWKTGRGCAIRVIKRVFNWADAEGHLRPNPIKAIKRSAVPSRARTMTGEQRAEVLSTIHDRPFRLFVEALQESGCRPSEVARVSAADVNLELGVWILQKHKTRKRTNKPRIIYFTPRLLEITKELMHQHPQGPLFRGPRGGRPFTKRGICSRFWRLRKKLPHLKDAIAYAYRHSFATDALTRGVGVAQVAELLGHSSTEMVSHHYGHLAEQVEHMKEAARKATGG